MTEEALTTFGRELQLLRKAAETFAATLPSLVPSSNVDAHTLRSQVSAHMLIQMAFIHLNTKFADDDTSANVRCVEAAIAMVKLFDDVDLVGLEILPPIMAVSPIALLRMGQPAEFVLERLADGWTGFNTRDGPPELCGGTVV